MKTLLWREYGFNRPILIAGLVFLFIPYVVALVVLVWPTNEPTSKDVAAGIAGAAVGSYGACQLTIALMAGYAIAGERADRSAEFLGYLPISRGRRLASKLILTTLVTAAVSAVNLTILWGIDSLAPWDIDMREAFDTARFTAVTGVVMFGVSWLISSFQSSPTIAVGGAIATPILIVMALMPIVETLENLQGVNFDEARFIAFWYPTTSLTLGIVGFAVGTWYFLKRVEP